MGGIEPHARKLCYVNTGVSEGEKKKENACPFCLNISLKIYSAEVAAARR